MIWFIKSSTDSKQLCIKRYLKFHAIPCYSMILNKADVHLSTGLDEELKTGGADAAQRSGNEARGLEI